MLKQALQISHVGVAFKLRLTSLEPSGTMGRRSTRNPLDVIVVPPRSTYRGRKFNSEGLAGVEDGADAERKREPIHIFALPYSVVLFGGFRVDKVETGYRQADMHRTRCTYISTCRFAI